MGGSEGASRISDDAQGFSMGLRRGTNLVRCVFEDDQRMCEELSKVARKDEKANNSEAGGLRNDGVRVLYDEPNRTRPKTTRSNGWIELNEAKMRNIETRVVLSKNATWNGRLSLGREDMIPWSP